MSTITSVSATVKDILIILLIDLFDEPAAVQP